MYESGMLRNYLQTASAAGSLLRRRALAAAEYDVR
jgi:hypothetical protein